MNEKNNQPDLNEVGWAYSPTAGGEGGRARPPYEGAPQAAKRGSVLLIVVVLLLLMAILGTSYLATGRVDRVTSSQDLVNTNVDALVDGVRDMAVSQIVSSLFNYNTTTGQYQYKSASAGYNNFDCPVYSLTQYEQGTGDFWLAERAPVIPSQLTPAPTVPPSLAGTLHPLWLAITAPIGGTATLQDPNSTSKPFMPAFEDPTLSPGVSGTGAYWSPYSTVAGAIGLPVFPTFKNGYPALTYTITGVTPANAPFVAGDADGDGIADCGLFRLPGVYADGLTYYAGVRIIDNNSAVNVNTAMEYQNDYRKDGTTQYYAYTYSPTTPSQPTIAYQKTAPATPTLTFFPSFFPSAVGLNDMLPAADLAALDSNVGDYPLNVFRFGGTPSVSPYQVGLTPFLLPAASGGAAIIAPVSDETQNASTDFGYVSLGDALYHQLGRRLGNPGLAAANTPYRAFSDADEAALAYHFCLLNPSAYDPNTQSGNAKPVGIGTTPIEVALNSSVFKNAPNYPANDPPYAPLRHQSGNGYQAAAASQERTTAVPPWKSYPASFNANTNATVLAEWFNDNFSPNNFTTFTPTALPSPLVAVLPINLRPYLTTHNAVSKVVAGNTPLTSADAIAGLTMTVANAGMAPYGDRGRWQPNVAYYASGFLNNGANLYVSDDCVTFSGGTAAAAGSDPITTTAYDSTDDAFNTVINKAAGFNGNGLFSGVFFCRASNVNLPPGGTIAEANNSTGAAVAWARPTYWSPHRRYFSGDYVYADANDLNAGGTNDPTYLRDQCHFYRCTAAAGVTGNTLYPTIGANANWVVWQPPTGALATKANVNTATFPELFRAFWNVMTVPFSTGAAGVYPPASATPGAPAPTLATPFAASATGATTSYEGTQFTSAPMGVSTAPKAVNGERMFRSPIRSTATYFDPYQVVMLRAAIAAVNAENLRSPEPTKGLRTVIARQITLTTGVGAGATPVNVTIYGNQPQPFITEVYAQTDTTQQQSDGLRNTQGYVAIELYNPYPFDIPLIGSGTGGIGTGDYSWALATLTPGANPATLTVLQGFDQSNYSANLIPSPATASSVGGNGAGYPVVPANGYLLIENYGSTGSATYRPTSSGLPRTGAIPNTNFPLINPQNRNTASNLPLLNVVCAPQLSVANLAGRELVILKRRSANGSASAGTLPSNTTVFKNGSAQDGAYCWNDSNPSLPNNTNNLNDYVPVDSFDFSGLQSVQTAAGAAVIHYARATSNYSDTTLKNKWLCVYPGPYDGNYNGSASNGYFAQSGVQYATWNPTTKDPASGQLDQDPWNPTAPNYAGTPSPGMTLGTTISTPTTPSSTDNVGPPTPGATYAPTFPIQLCNPAWGGPNKPALTNNVFPFGGFARNGDILEVPYIAAYRIQQIPLSPSLYPPLVALNSVSMDSAFADDEDPSDDNNEQIGRFCPLNPIVAGDTGISGATVRYGWAQCLFDFLTVQNPRDDYFPNVDPSLYPPVAASSSTYTTIGDVSDTKNAPPPYPTPVANSDSSLQANLLVGNQNTFTSASNSDAEATQGVEGLINVNTAPLQVLEALPLEVNPNTAAVSALDTQTLATNILNWRTGRTGVPISSLFQLNSVASFQTGGSSSAVDQNGSVPSGSNSVASQGDLTPGTGILNGFDETNLQLTRLSNLLTTRSDTFTVYVVVEGWQNAGTASAKLVVTRRMAYIVDRTGVTPTSKSVKVIPVPNN